MKVTLLCKAFIYRNISSIIKRLKNADVEARGQGATVGTGDSRSKDQRKSKSRDPRLARSRPELEDK